MNIPKEISHVFDNINLVSEHIYTQVKKTVSDYVGGRSAFIPISNDKIDGRMYLFPAPPIKRTEQQELSLLGKVINGIFAVTAAPLMLIGYSVVAAYKNSMLKSLDIKPQSKEKPAETISILKTEHVKVQETELESYNSSLLTDPSELADSSPEASVFSEGPHGNTIASARLELAEAIAALNASPPLSPNPSRMERAVTANLQLKVDQAEQKVIDLVKLSKGEKLYTPVIKFKETVEVHSNDGISHIPLKEDAFKRNVSRSRKATIIELKNHKNIDLNDLKWVIASTLGKQPLIQNLTSNEKKILPKFFLNCLLEVFEEAKRNPDMKPGENGQYDLDLIKNAFNLRIIEKNQTKEVITKKEFATLTHTLQRGDEGIYINVYKRKNIPFDVRRAPEYNDLRKAYEKGEWPEDQIHTITLTKLRTPEDIKALDNIFENIDFQDLAQKYLAG